MLYDFNIDINLPNVWYQNFHTRELCERCYPQTITKFHTIVLRSKERRETRIAVLFYSYFFLVSNVIKFDNSMEHKFKIEIRDISMDNINLAN